MKMKEKSQLVILWASKLPNSFADCTERTDQRLLRTMVREPPVGVRITLEMIFCSTINGSYVNMDTAHVYA